MFTHTVAFFCTITIRERNLAKPKYKFLASLARKSRHFTNNKFSLTAISVHNSPNYFKTSVEF